MRAVTRSHGHRRPGPCCCRSRTGSPAPRRRRQRRRLDVPYVPTHDGHRATRCSRWRHVKKGDVVYDLGCGDGRIVVTAAKEHGARGVGIDIEPGAHRGSEGERSQAGVTRAGGVQGRRPVRSRLRAGERGHAVPAARGQPEAEPQLWRQLKVGTRIVSHAFDMGEDWPPEDTQRVGHNTVYRWTIKREHKRATPRTTT